MTSENLYSEEVFKVEAKGHLRAICSYCAGFFVLANVLYSIAWWAEKMSTWQAQIVTVIFYILAGFAFFAFLFFAVSIFAYFKMFKAARKNLNQLDPTVFRIAFSEVVGPIPWGSRRGKDAD